MTLVLLCFLLSSHVQTHGDVSTDLHAAVRQNTVYHSPLKAKGRNVSALSVCGYIELTFVQILK